MATTRCVVCLSLHSSGAVITEAGQLRLCTGMQSHLAVCCKATLPFLCMGHVRVTTDKQQFERPLLQATRCLTKQPGGVLHFELSSRDIFSGTLCLDTCHLVGLRYGYALVCCGMHESPPGCGVPLP